MCLRKSAPKKTLPKNLLTFLGNGRYMSFTLYCSSSSWGNHFTFRCIARQANNSSVKETQATWHWKILWETKAALKLLPAKHTVEDDFVVENLVMYQKASKVLQTILPFNFNQIYLKYGGGHRIL